MMNNIFRIATRRSPLALWQAHYVKQQIEQNYPKLKVELCLMTTEGDKQLATSLAKIGGKGLFIKELEQALLNQIADMAVHSMKDMTAVLPTGMCLAAFFPREDPRDVLVSEKYTSLDELPNQAIVGTSSVRRQSQLLALRPDLQIKVLRGNVNTRLNKLAAGEFDAIILAAAGLKRLNLQEKIRSYFSLSEMLPAIGQGIIGVECLANNSAAIELLQPLNCENTALCMTAERQLNQVLGGHCAAPIAGYAHIQDKQLFLQAKVLSLDGTTILTAAADVPLTAASGVGQQVAEALLAQGAAQLLQASS